MPESSKWFLSLRFPHQNTVYASPLLHTRYIAHCLSCSYPRFVIYIAFLMAVRIPFPSSSKQVRFFTGQSCQPCAGQSLCRTLVSLFSWSLN
jgi:hypothetical protein